MTLDFLEKANKLNKDITETRKVLKAFDSAFANVIKLNDYDCERETTQLVILSHEPDLEKMIREYFVNKLATLEQLFEKMGSDNYETL